MNDSQSPIIAYRHQRWAGLVHQDWAQAFDQQDPLTWMASLPHERSRYRLSRQIYRVHTDKGLVYLKTILGLNERSMQKNSPWVGRLKWRLRPSRAIQTLHVSQAMLAHDIWCPPPILAAREYQGSQSRDIFIAQAVELPGLGMRLKDAASDAQRIEMIRTVMPKIVNLHQKRFLHGDLLPNNLHVTDDLSRVCFMDNDRTRLWPCPLPWWAIKRNLSQLVFRLLSHQGQAVAQACLDAYGQAANWNKSKQISYSATVLKVAKQRLEHYVPHDPQPPLPDDDVPPGQIR